MNTSSTFSRGKILYIILGLVVVLGGAFLLFKNETPVEESQSQNDRLMSIESYAKNSTFTIDGDAVTLVNGVSEVVVPDSASKVVTRYFGNEAKGDLNGDGKEDMAFLITQNNGGSGTFFYAVVALGGDNRYQATNAFLVGDRISPQSTYIPGNSREIHVNFAERKIGEPMTAEPSQGAVLLLKVTPQNVLEGLMR